VLGSSDDLLDVHMKIGIGFFGLPRCMAKTLPSIHEALLEPAGRLGTVCVRYHLYQQARVVNARSNEEGALDVSNYDPFTAWSGQLESPEDVAESLGLDSIQAHGDFWNDGGRSLRNLLLQLHSLEQVTRQLRGEDPDIVVFVRPDLRYLSSFEPALRAMGDPSTSRTVCLPFWQWAGGYNDRFAVCGRDAYETYGTRRARIADYLVRYPRRPLHSERLLMFALETQRLAVRPVSVQANRVRVDGREVDEDFSAVQLMRRLRWIGRELRKSFA
jgi:hypothetical protein